jgi:hypothetical protein
MNLSYKEVVSEIKLAGHIYDICKMGNEYAVAGSEGLCFLQIDATYQDYDISLLDRFFKGQALWRLSPLGNNQHLLLAFQGKPSLVLFSRSTDQVIKEFHNPFVDL